MTTAPVGGAGPSDDGPALPPAALPTGAGIAPEGFAQARAVAEAVLYEGYLLYPYRRSSAKNRYRWQFGVLLPRSALDPGSAADAGVAGSTEAWQQQTEVLLEAGGEAEIRVCLRFLHVQRRGIERRAAEGWMAVDDLEVDGERHLAFDEAVPREFELCVPLARLQDRGMSVALSAPGAVTVEALRTGTGETVGRIVRETRPVEAVLRLELSRADAPFPLHRLQCVAENAAAPAQAPPSRADALRISMVATHTLLGVRGGRFLSLLDPPMWAEEAARRCRNVHTFPVLSGRPGGQDVVLSSPIILYDHPQIAPESPGPLFDSGEIDEVLSLRTRTLTDAEKREVRATDPRAAALLDRTDSLPDDVLARLHGAVRSLRPVGDPTPELVVGGVPITGGTSVRLRPRRHGTDAQDLFLDGRTATVDRVLDDVDGGRFVAVTLDDDPGADLLREYGRHYQFGPDEIEPLS